MLNRKLLIAILFFLPISVFAQDITGLWKGTLYNDTTKQFYKYEVGISQEKGKLSGFSHTWFILGDKQYFGVKKVSIKKAPDGKILIEDDGLISNNYPVSPSKNVRQLNVLTLNASDSIMTLQGPFTTNRTKEYHSLTGSIKLERKNDFWQSALVPHLQELGMENKLSFVKEENDLIALVEAKQDEAVFKQLDQQYKEQVKKDQKQSKETERQSEAKLAAEKRANEENEKAALALAKQEAALKEKAAKETAKQQAARELQDKKLAEEKLKTEKNLAKQEVATKKLTENKIAKQETAKEQQARLQAEEKLKAENALVKQQAIAKKIAEKETIKQKAEKDQLAVKQQSAIKASAEKELVKPTNVAQVKKTVITSSPVYSIPAANVTQRKTILQQTVFFSSDSLMLTLYDNGEVDGDTVSVLMNGQLIIAKQGLSTTASKKTIYIPSTTDRVELVMYAESLGSIPPNTGLLVIRDGKDLYEIRFSGDLQKNASIVFNRKKE